MWLELAGSCPAFFWIGLKRKGDFGIVGGKGVDDGAGVEFGFDGVLMLCKEEDFNVCASVDGGVDGESLLAEVVDVVELA